MIDKPLSAAAKPLQIVEILGLEGRGSEKGDEAHERTDFDADVLRVSQMQHVVIKAVLFIPKANAFSAHIVHGLRDVDKVLEEFASHVLVSRILVRQFNSDGEHVEAIHGHPACAVGLLYILTG